MNGSKTWKLLAMVLCLLLCVAAAGAFADAALEASSATVNEANGAPSGKESSALTEVTKEESSSTEAAKGEAPPADTHETDGKPEDQDLSETPALTDAPESEVPVESVETPDQIDGDDQNAAETPAPIDEPEDEIPNEVGEEEPEAPADEGDGLEDDATELPDDESELIEEEIEDAQETPVINPTIKLWGYIDGDVIVEGTLVTIQAEIGGIPERMEYDVQWQNDSSGEFHNVPGETDTRVTFSATEENVNWAWRLELTVYDTAEAV